MMNGRASRWLPLAVSGLIVALGIGGCASDVSTLDPALTTAPAADTLGGHVLIEINRLGPLIGPRLVLYIAAIIGLAAVLRWGITLSVTIAWRLGWDGERRLARVRSFLELAVLIITALLIGRAFFRVVPLLSFAFVGLSGLIAALAVPGGLQDFAAGISLAGRGRFVEGDQIEVDGNEGPVRHIGILRTMLRLPDGRTLWLPNRVVVRSAVHVGRAQQALPVNVPLPAGPDDPEYREHLRRAAHLNPFRRAGSSPSLRKDGDGWVLSFQTWATRRPEIAASAMNNTLRTAAAPMLREPPTTEDPASQTSEASS